MSEELRCLRFAVGPALILILALVLFEATAFDAPDFASNLARVVGQAVAGDPTATTATAGSLGARVLWTATALLFLSSAAATLVIAFMILRDFASTSGVRLLCATVALLVGMELVAGLSGVAPAFESLFDITAVPLGALPDGARRFAPMIRAAFTVNLIAAIVPAFGLVAGCACTIQRPGGAASELEHVQLRMRRLDNVLHLGSAMLATGVLHLLAWMRVPAQLPGIDADLATSIQTSASTLSMYWGAAYSALIAAWYLPSSRALAAQARSVVARESKQLGVEDPDEWLRKRGFASSPLQRVPQITAMLGPLLIGPAGALVAELAKAIG